MAPEKNEKNENGVPAGPSWAGDPFGVCFPGAIPEMGAIRHRHYSKKTTLPQGVPLGFPGHFLF